MRNRKAPGRHCGIFSKSGAAPDRGNTGRRSGYAGYKAGFINFMTVRDIPSRRGLKIHSDGAVFSKNYKEQYKEILLEVAELE